ncbi:hypothetical protein L1049_027252 [Liquidambar formosana]|uniref:Uncharacterized protein n=1 Tax=Liquidambar formosana TaxID=63359 RepID=A0AAP0N0S8_LIQFO
MVEGEEVVGGKTQPQSEQKNGDGGVIPAKKRLVKSMMYDYLVQSFASLFSSSRVTSSNKRSAVVPA